MIKGSAVERGSTVIPDGFVDRGIRKTRWSNVPTSMRTKLLKSPLVWKGSMKKFLELLNP